MSNITQIYRPGQFLVPTRDFSSEEELMRVLEAEDLTSGTGNPPRYLYRGQTGRYFRKWPPRDKWFAPADSYEMDSLIPSDYRGMEEAIRAGKKDDIDIQFQFGNEIALLRQLVTYVALGNIPSSQPAITNAWFQRLISAHGVEFLGRLGSVGQHCGLQTAYLDVTASKQVALWFASHLWDGNNTYAQGSKGFIYRINYDAMVQSGTAVNIMCGWTGMGSCAWIDIQDTPTVLTSRPSNQHGWSLIRFESPWWLLELIQKGGIELFAFNRGTSPSKVNTLQEQQHIAPPSDAVVAALDAMYRNGNYLQELQNEVDKQITVKRLSSGINVTDSKTLKAIFRGW